MISGEDAGRISDLARRYGVSRVLLFGSSAAPGGDARDIGLAVDGIEPALFFALAVSNGLISGQLADRLKPYLAFRHYFSHGYSLDLVAGRLVPLVTEARSLFAEMEREVCGRECEEA